MLDNNRPPGPTWSRSWATVARNKSKTVFEVTGFQQDQRVRRAEAILARSLNANAVLFDFGTQLPSKAAAYKLIQSIGPLLGAKTVSRARNPKTLLIETRYAEDAHRDMAIKEGVTYANVNFRATLALGLESDLVKVNFKELPFVSQEALTAGLRTEMSHYGRVCQIRLYLEPETKIFEGEATVILDVTQPPNTLDHEQYLKLQRYIHFENWDQTFPVSWKGCPPLCSFCKQEGHKRSECPKLKQVACFHCHQFGHFQKHYPLRRQQQQVAPVERLSEQDLLDSFSIDSKEEAAPENPNDETPSIRSSMPWDIEISHAATSKDQHPQNTQNSNVGQPDDLDITMRDRPLHNTLREEPTTTGEPDPKQPKIYNT
ncbi:hypothetical protein BJV82DRAFT_582709 [Fennellomyces sp. T-0311]|nr:hypothetical protein BJV82DRAFT_582709 [Fennellomyces sp. T-0311]